jgi:hypothetical protein
MTGRGSRRAAFAGASWQSSSEAAWVETPRRARSASLVMGDPAVLQKHLMPTL